MATNPKKASSRETRVVITKSAARDSRPGPALSNADEETHLRDVEDTRPEPTNQAVLERAAMLEAQLPKLINSRIQEVQEFLLTNVAPLALAFNNGIADANDVLKTALGSDPGWAPLLTTAESNLLVAAKSRITVFVKRYMNLDDEEAALYMSRIASQEFGGNDAVNRLLHEMLKVSHVPGQEKGAESPVPRLPATKRPRQRRGR